MPDSWGEVSAEVAEHLGIPPDTIMTDEQLAEFQHRFHEAMVVGNYQHRVLPQPEEDPAVRKLAVLRAAVQQVLDDEESRPGGWGPDVTCVYVLQEAMEQTAP